MVLKIVLLGTGTPIIDLEREGAAIAIVYGKFVILFDTGRGVVRRLVQAGLNPDQIYHVFLTHLHSDHITGLPDFMYTVGVMGRDQALNIYGPPGTNRMVHHLKKAFSEDVRVRVNGLENGEPITYKIISHEIDQDVILNKNQVKISCFPVIHGEWVCFGYRIEADGKIIVISGDTAPSESLIENAKDCDILIHEVYSDSALRKRSENWQKYHKLMHTSSIELGQIAAQINPKKLVLYHQLYWSGSDEDIIKDIKQNYSSEIISAKDLDEISLST